MSELHRSPLRLVVPSERHGAFKLQSEVVLKEKAGDIKPGQVKGKNATLETAVTNALAVPNLVAPSKTKQSRQKSGKDGKKAVADLVSPPAKTKKGGHEPITNTSSWTKEVRLGRTSCLNTLKGLSAFVQE